MFLTVSDWLATRLRALVVSDLNRSSLSLSFPISRETRVGLRLQATPMRGEQFLP